MACWRRKPTGQHAGGSTVVHADHGSQGGFNWSSQHLDHGGVDGQAGRVDDGIDRALADEVAGSAVAQA
jgi:putative transposase